MEEGLMIPKKVQANGAEAQPHVLMAAPSLRGRVTALVRCVLYLILAAAFAALALWPLTAVFHVALNVESAPPMALLLLVQVLLALTTVIIPTAVMLRFTREPVAVFGWGTGARLRQLSLGVISGLGLMSLLIGLIAAGGGITLRLSSDPLGTLAAHGLGYALVFLLLAIGEEGLMRGYTMVQLSRALSFWPAALVSSACFVAIHLGHKSETPAGLLQVGLAGLALAYSFRRSGGLWFAWGWHAAWDFAETFVYGVPDSGVTARGSLLISQLHGPAWLTGGAAGPEGSWLVFPVMAALALFARFTLSQDRPDRA
jgi:membrane protease YdiL (CAAX protease family)